MRSCLGGVWSHTQLGKLCRIDCRETKGETLRWHTRLKGLLGLSGGECSVVAGWTKLCTHSGVQWQPAGWSYRSHEQREGCLYRWEQKAMCLPRGTVLGTTSVPRNSSSRGMALSSFKM